MKSKILTSIFALSTVFMMACSEDPTSTNPTPNDSCELAAGEKIAVLSPEANNTFSVGETVTVRWVADADEFTGFLVKVSADGGDIWDIVVNESLHTDATGVGCLEYSWVITEDLLDAGATNDQVLVRIQDYSDSSLRDTSEPITIEP